MRIVMVILEYSPITDGAHAEGLRTSACFALIPRIAA
jgi:hypothetical protein